jgi:hypothetical protein
VENSETGVRTSEVASLTLADGTISRNGRIAIDDITASDSTVRSGSFSLSNLELDDNGLVYYSNEQAGVLYAPRLGGTGASLTQVTARRNRARSGIITLSHCIGGITMDRVVIEETSLDKTYDDGVTVRMSNLVGALSIKDSRFSRNALGDSGALLHLDAASDVTSIVLSGVTVTETYGPLSYYGALYIGDMAGTKVDLLDVTFTNNTGRRAGAINLDNVQAPVRISGASPDAPARFAYNTPLGTVETFEGAASIVARDVDSLTLVNVEFVGDVGAYAGSVFARARNDHRGRYSSFVATNVLLTDVSTSTSSSQASGPAVFVRNYDSVVLRDTTFRRCSSTEGNIGALYASARDEILLDRCTFLDNEAEGGTGGAYLEHADGGLEPEDEGGFPLASLRLTNVTFDGNTGAGSRSYTSAYGGGALAIDHLAPVSMVDTRFANNGILAGGSASYATRRGGAVMYSCLSSSPHGLNCTLDLDNCTFTSNYVQSNGGALAVNTVDAVSMRDVVVQRNAALEAGGGVWLDDVPTVDIATTLFDSNVAGGTTYDSLARGQGGGLWFDCDRVLEEGDEVTVSLTEVGFIDNRAVGIGAGAFIEDAADLTIHQSAFLRNVALNGDQAEDEECGGGLHANADRLSVSMSTFEANVLLDGEGRGGGGGALCIKSPEVFLGQATLDQVYLVNNVAVAGAWGVQFDRYGEENQLNVTESSVTAGAPSSLPVVSFPDGASSPLPASFAEMATGMPVADKVTALYSLAYSFRNDGSNPAPLDGAQLPTTRQFYVFANPRTNYDLRVTMSACYINGVLAHLDSKRAHFDCVGTTGEAGTNVVLSAARPTAGTLEPGTYTITMEFFMQPYPEVINATFTVLAEEDGTQFGGDAAAGAAAVPFPTSIAGVPDPVGHWRLDEQAPASGDVAADSSGNGLVGTFVGSPATQRMTMPDGTVRSVLRFDSVDQYVVVPYDPAFSTKAGESLTVTAWVYLCQQANAYLVSAGAAWDLSLNENAVSNGVSSTSSASAGEFRSFGSCGGSSQSAHGTNVISHGAWHFLSGRYLAEGENATLELAVDRSTTDCPDCTDEPGTTRFADCGADLWLAQRYNFPQSDPLYGMLADVRIYRDYLSTAELDAIYLATGGTTAHRTATETAGTSISLPDWPPSDASHVCNYPLYRGEQAAGVSVFEDSAPRVATLMEHEWPTLSLTSVCACALDESITGIECYDATRRVTFDGYSTMQPTSKVHACLLQFGADFEGLDSTCDAEDSCYVDPLARPSFLYPPAPDTPAPATPSPGGDGDGEGEGELDGGPGDERAGVMEEDGVDHLLNAMIAFLILFLIACSCAGVFAYTLHRLRKRGAIDSASVASSLELERFGSAGRRASQYVSTRHAGSSSGASGRESRMSRGSPHVSLSEVGGGGNYGSAPALLAKGADGTYAPAPGMGAGAASTYGEAPVEGHYSAAPMAPRSQGSSAGTAAGAGYGSVPDPIDGAQYGAAPPSKDPLSPRMRKSASSRRRKRSNPSRPALDDSNYAKIAFDQDDASRSGSAGTGAAADYGAPPDAVAGRAGGNYMDLEDAVQR